jgi:hypothetical protein
VRWPVGAFFLQVRSLKNTQSFVQFVLADQNEKIRYCYDQYHLAYVLRAQQRKTNRYQRKSLLHVRARLNHPKRDGQPDKLHSKLKTSLRQENLFLCRYGQMESKTCQRGFQSR